MIAFSHKLKKSLLDPQQLYAGNTFFGHFFSTTRYLEGGLEGRQVPREVSLSPREVAAGLAEDLAPALDLLLRRRAGK